LYIENQRIRKKFRDRVEELWKRKGAKLREFSVRGRRQQPRFTRSWREQQLDALQDLVLDAYHPWLKKWVNKNTARVHFVFSRTDPRPERGRIVRKTLLARGLERKHLVYATFRADDRCLKVGRTNVGSKRISQQSKDVSFWHAKKIVVYIPHSKEKRVLPALECALTHLLDPLNKEVWPAQSKYLDKCKACRDCDRVRALVEALFPA
jgi:hypothetical protein